MDKSEAMTPRERWLAAIQFQPVDRLPFYAKLGHGYTQAQVEPFQSMTNDAVEDWAGSDKHSWINRCFSEVRQTTSVEERWEGGCHTTVYRTPYGETRWVEQFDVKSQAWYPVVFPIRDVETIKLMTAFFEDTSVELDEDTHQRNIERAKGMGQDAFTFTSIGNSPLMWFIEEFAGIANGHYLLNDHQQEVEALFEAIQRVLLKRTEILAQHSVADSIYMFENTSTTLISPDQFRRYCYRHLTEYGEITRRYGRILFLHMCGKLKLLLPDLATLPAEAIEAFTAPPPPRRYPPGRRARRMPRPMPYRRYPCDAVDAACWRNHRRNRGGVGHNATSPRHRGVLSRRDAPALHAGDD